MSTHALTVVCPNCNAQAGKACTMPTDNGRRFIRSLHWARIDASNEQARTETLAVAV